MWFIPFADIVKPESAQLEIVNHKRGTLSVIPSQVPFLKTSILFTGFPAQKKPVRKKRYPVPDDFGDFVPMPTRSGRKPKVSENSMNGCVIKWLLILGLIAVLVYLLEPYL